MASIGQIFAEARLKKNVTPSQAAAATHMKVQHIDALERGDFKQMAAPAYVKGFIKLYAEYLGLDPMPLLRQYADQLSAAPAAPVRRASVIKAVQPVPPPPEPKGEGGDEEKVAPETEASSSAQPDGAALYARWKKVIWAVAAVGVILLLGFGLWGRGKSPSEEPAAPQKLAPLKGEGPALVEEPPEPYLEKMNEAAPKP